MTAPIASGWSGCRVGLAPTGKRRLVTAHAKTGLMHSSNDSRCSITSSTRAMIDQLRHGQIERVGGL
jgi:hypothetical protein